MPDDMVYVKFFFDWFFLVGKAFPCLRPALPFSATPSAGDAPAEGDNILTKLSNCARHRKAKACQWPFGHQSQLIFIESGESSLNGAAGPCHAVENRP